VLATKQCDSEVGRGLDLLDEGSLLQMLPALDAALCGQPQSIFPESTLASLVVLCNMSSLPSFSVQQSCPTCLLARWFSSPTCSASQRSSANRNARLYVLAWLTSIISCAGGLKGEKLLYLVRLPPNPCARPQNVISDNLFVLS
jgi:hypothetical protein